MAKFIVLQTFNRSEIVVNVELIRYIAAGGPGRTLLTFDQTHEVAVNCDLLEVMRRINHQ